jgi:flagellar basal-body rod protein FlgB
VNVIEKALFSSGAIPWLKKGLDVSEMRRRVTAENVANLHTQGYRAQRVAFEEHLRGVSGPPALLVHTDQRHLGASANDISAEAVPSDDPVLPNGINNVDVEEEMAAMGWNRLQMTALTRFMSKKYALLNDAIRASRG